MASDRHSHSAQGQVQGGTAHPPLLKLTLAQPPPAVEEPSNVPHRPQPSLADQQLPEANQGLPMALPPAGSSNIGELDGYSTFVPAANDRWQSIPAQSLPTHLGLSHDDKSFSTMLHHESHFPEPLDASMMPAFDLASKPFMTQGHAMNPSGIPANTPDLMPNTVTESPTSIPEPNAIHGVYAQDFTPFLRNARPPSAASWPSSSATQSSAGGHEGQSLEPPIQPSVRRTATSPQLFSFGTASTAPPHSPHKAATMHQPWRYVDPNFPLMPSGSLPSSDHSSSTSADRRTSTISVDMDEAEDDAEHGYIGSSDLSAKARDRNNRRQGVTCDQCREKHLRCDLADRSPEAARIGNRPRSAGSLIPSVPCSRCFEKGFTCTKTNALPSRRYPRPSRTGKRIEQARLMHGSVAADLANRRQSTGGDFARQNSGSSTSQFDVSHADSKLSSTLLSNAASLKLLTCYFATAHIQIPVVDFASFSSRYNLAAGDVRKMSVMLNGGSPLENLPSIPPPLPPGMPNLWPGSQESTISTPGTTEALIAAMQAWAAHYTDMPLAFGSQAKALGLEGGSSSAPANHGESQALPRRRQSSIALEGDDSENSVEDQSEYGHLPPAKRPKRKQGVACDTCRLRRVRCDLMERKDGMPCTRCQDKKIVCTDEYIQQKRRENEAKLRKEREKLRKQLGSAGSSGGDATSSQLEMTNPSQLGDNPDPLAWTEMSSVPAMVSLEQEPARFGLARQGFCHELLTRAVVLLHKHRLLYRPSVEAVQVLVLLIHLFDMVDPSFAAQMTAASASHMRALGLQSVDEVDENDTRSVQNLFNLMQDKRVWCTAWTRDAIACCVHRKAPQYFEETPIKIRGGLANARATAGFAPELTPAMGLSFSVMSLLQIGVLGRFVTKHIDNIAVPDHPPPQERFPMLPSAADTLKLRRACQAAWKSNDALIDFFDRCTLKAWNQMEALKIHQPKVWVAAVKVSSAMVTLSIFRTLGERQRLNQTYLQAVREAHGPQSIAPDDVAQSQALTELFEESRQRTLLVCRRVARLVQKMHRRPSLTFQTGGILLKQLFAVAQFIARSPVDLSGESGGHFSDSMLHPPGVYGGTAAGSPFSNDPVGFSSWDAPQGHNLATTGTFIPTVQPEAPASPSELYDLAMGYDAPLPRFTAALKEVEVEACLMALEQIGYAWPVEAEVQSIKSIMQSERMRSFGLPA